MLDILGQILPAAGSIAGGAVEGQKLYDDRARLMQVMALAKAQEERTQAMHPLQMQQAQGQIQGQALSNTRAEHLQGPVAEDFLTSLQALDPKLGQVPEGNRMDLLDYLDVYNAEQSRGAANYRAQLPPKGQGQKDFTKLLTLYNSATAKLTPGEGLEAIMRADPEIGGAMRSDPNIRDMQTFKLALKKLLKDKYGFDIDASGGAPAGPKTFNPGSFGWD